MGTPWFGSPKSTCVWSVSTKTWMAPLRDAISYHKIQLGLPKVINLVGWPYPIYSIYHRPCGLQITQQERLNVRMDVGVGLRLENCADPRPLEHMSFLQLQPMAGTTGNVAGVNRILHVSNVGHGCWWNLSLFWQPPIFQLLLVPFVILSLPSGHQTWLGNPPFVVDFPNYKPPLTSVFKKNISAGDLFHFC